MDKLLRKRTGRGKAETSDMTELGWSFRAAEARGTRELAQSIFDFPATRSAIEVTLNMCVGVACPPHPITCTQAAMLALGGHDELRPESLNVIVRRYRPGQGLPAHFDRYVCSLLT